MNQENQDDQPSNNQANSALYIKLFLSVAIFIATVLLHGAIKDPSGNGQMNPILLLAASGALIGLWSWRPKKT